MYQVQMQFVPGNNIIWVARLTPKDPIYNFSNKADAQAKANELQNADSTGRQYRVAQI